MRVVAQAAVLGISVLARAIPAAYGAALQNARKGGVDAAARASKGGKGGSVFSTNKISVDEALLVLNVEKAEVVSKPELIQKVSELMNEWVVLFRLCPSFDFEFRIFENYA